MYKIFSLHSLTVARISSYSIPVGSEQSHTQEADVIADVCMLVLLVLAVCCPQWICCVGVSCAAQCQLLGVLAALGASLLSRSMKQALSGVQWYDCRRSEIFSCQLVKSPTAAALQSDQLPRTRRLMFLAHALCTCPL